MIRKSFLLSVCAATMLATNGVNMIGTGTVSRAMGGSGVAHYSHGVEAINKNPALMANAEADEFQFDLTYFNATLESTVYDEMPLNTNPSRDEPVTAKSENHLETNFIPSIGYLYRINNRWNFGIGLIGTAGMGADYADSPSHRKLKTAMMLMKVVPAFSYRAERFNFGFAPVLGLGSLSINYDEDYTKRDADGSISQSTRPGLFGTNIGGEELVPSLGFQAGIEYRATETLRFGAVYHSSLIYTYKDVANFEQFGVDGIAYEAERYVYDHGVPLPFFQKLFTDSVYKLCGQEGDASRAAPTSENLDDLTLEQPWEFAAGFAYDPRSDVTLTMDYRYIAWENAQGYREFGWKSQHVYALGMEYRGRFDRRDFALRLGYNYAESPLRGVSGENGIERVDMQGHKVFKQALSMLNVVGFPAIATTHYSAGFGYAFSERMTLDAALMYAPEVTVTREGSLLDLPDFPLVEENSIDYSYTAKMRQLSLSAGINYRF
jgi:long-chain fatty acid transport protein